VVERLDEPGLEQLGPGGETVKLGQVPVVEINGDALLKRGRGPGWPTVIAVQMGQADRLNLVEGELSLGEALAGGARAEAGVEEHAALAVAQNGGVTTGTGAEHAESQLELACGPCPPARGRRSVGVG